jgi:hypothetical protein
VKQGPKLEQLKFIQAFDLALWPWPAKSNVSAITDFLRTFTVITSIRMPSWLKQADSALESLLALVESEKDARIRAALLWSTTFEDEVSDVERTTITCDTTGYRIPDSFGLRLMKVPGFDPDLLLSGPKPALADAARRETPIVALAWLRAAWQRVVLNHETLEAVIDGFIRSHNNIVLMKEVDTLGLPKSVPHDVRVSWLCTIARYSMEDKVAPLLGPLPCQMCLDIDFQIFRLDFRFRIASY